VSGISSPPIKLSKLVVNQVQLYDLEFVGSNLVLESAMKGMKTCCLAEIS